MRTVGVTKLHLSSWGSLKGAAWSCTGSRWAVWSALLGPAFFTGADTILYNNILSYFINGAILSDDSVESALKALANGNAWPVLAKILRIGFLSCVEFQEKMSPHELLQNLALKWTVQWAPCQAADALRRRQEEM